MLYPLRFQPIFRRYVWGGRRLKDLLGKETGTDETCAESWEIVDHGQDQSVVLAGALAGSTLHDIVAEQGKELFGRHHPQSRFPLLLKFLDSQTNLSVQVHPDDGQAARLDPPDLGKTEAWIILHADPEARVYAGLKPGVRREELAQAIAAGTTEACLHSFHPAIGDCVFLPAGTVHALGAGILMAEIQQSSDTTFRLFDWNRVDKDGNSRPLHVDEALELIDFEAGAVAPRIPQPLSPTANRLVGCDKFVLDRYEIDARTVLPDQQSCRLLAVLSGSVTVARDPSGQELRMGQTVLLPACLGEVTIDTSADATMLVISLP